MPLTKSQQKIIKAYSSQLSPKEIAEELRVPEKEIIRYLKKKMRPDKLKKMMSKFAPKAIVEDFSFKKFFKENYIYFGILIFLVIVSYTNSLGNAFVSDDVGGIQNNADIGKISYVFDSYTGIVQRFLFFSANKIFGLNPTYFRLTNIFFHLGSVLLIFIIFTILYNKRLAVFTAAIFAVHPFLIESVGWIAGHPYVESAFYFLLSFLFYILSEKKKKNLYFSFGFFILCMSASTRFFILAFVFPLYELLLGDIKNNWKKSVTFLASGLVLAVAALLQVGGRVSTLQSDYYLTPGKDSLLIKIPTSVASYFSLIFWPDKLSLYHTEMVFTTFEYWITVLVFLAYLGLIILAYFKNQKAISFWLIFFLIPLAPTLSPLRIAWAVAERYAYLSTLGIIFIVAWALYKLSEKEKIQTAVYVFFWVIVAALSIRTIIRNTDWKNEETLWFATAKTSPSGPNIHNNLGAIYQGKGEYQKAIDEFQLAIKINPLYADAYHNLGNTYYSMQNYDAAEASYKKATELNLKLWQSHQNLAAIYYAKGRFKDAKQELEIASKLNPNEASINQNLDLVNNALNSGQNLAPVSSPQ
jgi:protein O-mannosyl-transferase